MSLMACKEGLNNGQVSYIQLSSIFNLISICIWDIVYRENREIVPKLCQMTDKSSDLGAGNAMIRSLLKGGKVPLKSLLLVVSL